MNCGTAKSGSGPEDFPLGDRLGRRVMWSKLYGRTVCAQNGDRRRRYPHYPKRTGLNTLVNDFTSPPGPVKRIAESTVRRLSAYLRFLEESAEKGFETISSDALARRGGTTSAQVRKDLSFFGSFGKRGLGYSVEELTASLREILGLGREWNV